MKKMLFVCAVISVLLPACAPGATRFDQIPRSGMVPTTQDVAQVAANLTTASNALNTAVTDLVATVSNLSTSGGASIPVLSNRVDQVEDDLAASIGNYSNSYLKVSGTWKGSGFNYYYAGMTNSRPIYTVDFGGNIGYDSVYFNGTNWVAVQSVTGSLFNDASSPLIPHHQSAELITNSIPPQVLARNLTNEYSSDSMYLRFISGAEATLQDEIYLEAWNQVQAFITNRENSSINGYIFSGYTNSRPVFSANGTNHFEYAAGYWFRRSLWSERTSFMTSRSYLPPRTAKMVQLDGSLSTATNIWSAAYANNMAVESDIFALAGNLTNSFILIGDEEFVFYDTTNDRPRFVGTGASDIANEYWVFYASGHWMRPSYITEGVEYCLINEDITYSIFPPPPTCTFYHAPVYVYTNANGPTRSFYTDGDGNNQPVLYKRYAD